MFGPSTDRGIVRRYYVYRATLSLGFITPVFTLYLLRSLSFAEVGALSAIVSALSIGGEVPTGYVGDRLGRRASLLLSVGFTVASLAGFVLAAGFLWYALLYALWALAMTFRSGSIDAWLYDVLEERLDAARFSHVRGRGDAVQRWTAAGTMVAGGLLYGLDPRSPFVAAVGLNLLAIPVLLSLPKNRQYEDDLPDETTRLGPLEGLAVVRDHLTRPPLRSLVVYVTLFYAVVGVANTYVQPLAIERLAPSAAGLGLQVPAEGALAAARSGEAGPALALGLGVLYAVIAAVSSLGGYYAGAIEARLGVRRAVLLGTVAAAIVLVLPLGVALLALPAVAAIRTGRPLLQPIVNGYVNDHATGVGRSTLLSAISMIYMAIRAPLAVGAGLLADATTATTTVALLGVLFLGCGGTVWMLGTVAPPATSPSDATAPGD